MNRSSFNRLRGRGLYLEVRDLVAATPAPLTNYEIREALVVKHTLDRADRAAMMQLYERILRATEQLHGDGLLKRDEGIGANKHLIYKYTTAACSA